VAVSRPSHPAAEHAGAEHSAAEHAGAEHSAAEHAGAEHFAVEPEILSGEDGSESRPWGLAQRPPRLLLTLLGDYWWQHTESLPSAALVALLAEFGVSDSAARAALSRLTRNRLLVTSKVGRRTVVRLSERAAQILDEGARHIFSFGRQIQPWDGMWSLVAFSIPEHNRAARDALRKQLRWLGFAPLYDGLWVAPRDRASEVVSQLSGLGISTATAFRATTVPGIGPDGFPQRAWDLDDLRARYDGFISHAQRLQERALAGQVSPVEALVARTRVMDEWRAFPGLDPDLPGELLPDAWPRAAARELFIVTYDLLGPLAAHRVRQIIARYSRDLATRAAPPWPPCHDPRQAPAGGSAGGEPEQPDGVVLEDLRAYLGLDRQRVEVGQPAIGGDQRIVRAEQDPVLQQGVGVLDELRREVLG
jgi:phenylacetic acid degradation operon negative regulatory protein